MGVYKVEIVNLFSFGFYFSVNNAIYIGIQEVICQRADNFL